MSKHTKLLSGLLCTSLCTSLVGACAIGDEASDDFVKGEDGKADASALATILDFEWDGELVSTSVWDAKSTIQDQLLYTIGHLNGNRAVGRLDRLTLTNVQKTDAGGGKTKVTYHAVMPVAWGSKTNLPTSYTFTLPKDVSYTGTDAFTAKYKEKCVDFGAHEVTSGSMWYYYRPARSGCALDDADVVKLSVSATVSTVNTTGKFPEYHKVWEDNALRMVAVFGKYEDGATSGDAGIDAYNEFVASVKTSLAAYPVTTTPSTVPTSPGVGAPDISFTATLPGGRSIEVTALLVDNVRTSDPAFNARYEALSTRADLIAYNGHAGLGQNVRALAKKGKWVAGQYVIVFMNGCDTYAYVDGSLAETRGLVNPDDPTGSKYMEIVTNGMPSFFASFSDASLALLGALIKVDAPTNYEQIFKKIDSSQIVLVTGEQDNVYFPGYPGGGGGGGGEFTPIRETTTVAKGETLAFETPSAPAGTYVVKLAHDPALPGGDADLYVRVGSAPTTTTYDCRPYKSGSDEECRVTLTTAQKIYMGVAGYGAGENAFVLTVDKEGGVTPPPATWAGIDESGTVTKSQEKRWQTPALAAGSYSFEITGSGDADLYVRMGTAPTTGTYDCRPYRSGSNETCVVTVPAGAPVHVMVRGYAASSTFRLVGTAH